MLDRSAYRYLPTNRVFALLWAGQAVSALGDALFDVAIVWYLLEVTGSALAASGIAVATIMGRAVGSLVAGASIDRAGARPVMLWSDLVCLLLTLGAALRWLAGHPPSPPELYALALAAAVGGGWFTPARASAIPEVVQRERLIHANALDAASGGAVAALGWALGGLVAASIGPGPALLVSYFAHARRVRFREGRGLVARGGCLL